MNGAREPRRRLSRTAILVLAVAVSAACRTFTPPPPRESPGSGPSARFTLVEVDSGLPRSRQWREGFDVADIDGDGDLDIVHGPPRKGPRRPGIFVNDGRGAFRFWQEARFPPLPLDYGDSAAADFNGDGTVDVAFAMHLTGITVLVNEGRGNFSESSEGLELARPGGGRAGVFSSRALEAVDWNGDRRIDLVAVGEGPTPGPDAGSGSRGLRVFLNRGGGWETIGPPAADELFADDLDVGDVDGDGRPDAVTGSNVVGLRSIVKRGEGAGWRDRNVAELRENAVVRAVAVARFDADRLDDVALAYASVQGGKWRNGIDLLLSRGTRFERSSLAAGKGMEGIVALAAGDLDGDGATDLVALGHDGAIQTFAGDGEGNLTGDAALPAPEWRAGCAGIHVHLADVDGDRADEIIASFAGEPTLESAAGGRADCRSGGGLQVWKVRPTPR